MRQVKLGIGRLVAGVFVAVALVACSPSPHTALPSSHLSMGGSQTDSRAVQTNSPTMQTGSNGPQAEKSGPYVAEIKAAAKKAHSQFARDVLKDGVITREEYLTAMNRYKSCMEDRGITVNFIDRNGYYQIETVSKSQPDGRADAACSKGTILYIPGLYKRTLTDPENRGFFSQVYRCMDRLGLIPSGYTEQAYIADLLANAVKVTYQDGVAVNPPTTMVQGPTFPYFDADDPIREACMENPQNPVVRPPSAGGVQQTQ